MCSIYIRNWNASAECTIRALAWRVEVRRNGRVISIYGGPEASCLTTPAQEEWCFIQKDDHFLSYHMLFGIRPVVAVVHRSAYTPSALYFLGICPQQRAAEGELFYYCRRGCEPELRLRPPTF